MIMGKKLANTLLFLAVLAAAVGMTLYVGQGVVSVLVYNFIFLAVMVVIYFICLFGGMYRYFPSRISGQEDERLYRRYQQERGRPGRY